MCKSDGQYESDEFPGSDQMPQLAEALSALTESGPAVPRRVDEAILAQARRALSRPKRKRWRGPALAAASIALAGVITWLAFSPAPRPPAASRAPLTEIAADLPGDLDRSGRVNIADAFALARGLKDGTPPTDGDFNGDGRIDSADVEALAMRAVALKPRAES